MQSKGDRGLGDKANLARDSIFEAAAAFQGARLEGPRWGMPDATTFADLKASCACRVCPCSAVCFRAEVRRVALRDWRTSVKRSLEGETGATRAPNEVSRAASFVNAETRPATRGRYHPVTSSIGLKRMCLRSSADADSTPRAIQSSCTRCSDLVASYGSLVLGVWRGHCRQGVCDGAGFLRRQHNTT
jgi:ribosomal protein S14